MAVYYVGMQVAQVGGSPSSAEQQATLSFGGKYAGPQWVYIEHNGSDNNAEPDWMGWIKLELVPRYSDGAPPSNEALTFQHNGMTIPVIPQYSTVPIRNWAGVPNPNLALIPPHYQFVEQEISHDVPLEELLEYNELVSEISGIAENLAEHITPEFYRNYQLSNSSLETLVQTASWESTAKRLNGVTGTIDQVTKAVKYGAIFWKEYNESGIAEGVNVVASKAVTDFAIASASGAVGRVVQGGAVALTTFALAGAAAPAIVGVTAVAVGVVAGTLASNVVTTILESKFDSDEGGSSLFKMALLNSTAVSGTLGNFTLGQAAPKAQWEYNADTGVFKWLTKPNAAEIARLKTQLGFDNKSLSISGDKQPEKDDLIFGGNGTDTLKGLTGDDALFGKKGNDLLVGDAGNDVLDGGAGGDTLDGGLGDDLLNGGDGIDTATYAAFTIAITADLTTSEVTHFGDAVTYTDTLFSVENIVGGSGDDKITGDDEANVLSGAGGIDTIRGGLGDDIVEGGAGADKLFDAHGSDTLSYRSSKTGVTIDLLNNVFTGGDATGDVIENKGTGGIFESAFENLIGSKAVDKLAGDARDNTIEGLSGGDILLGGGGFDTLSYANSTKAVTVNLTTGQAAGGDAAGDKFGVTINKIFSTDFENITGSAWNDVLTGNAGLNVIDGGGGNDIIYGRGEGDYLSGGEGIDTLSYAGVTAKITIFPLSTSSDYVSGFERVIGGSNDDSLSGMAYIDGAAGNDRIYAATTRSGQYTGGNTLIGGAGVDTISYAGHRNSVTLDLLSGTGISGTEPKDKVSGFENAIGSAVADRIFGTNAANELYGKDGNDVLMGRGGADKLDGGNGFDIASYETEAGAITVDLGTLVNGAPLAAKAAAGDILISIEGLIGGKGADSLTGDDNSNELRGSAGNDILDGGKGADTLVGGLGADVLTGGEGADVFHFDLLNGGADRITDFTQRTDRLSFNKAAFANFELATVVNTSNPKATSGNGPQFLFDIDDGKLYWDADGVGKGAVKHIATLDGISNLTAKDFSGLAIADPGFPINGTKFAGDPANTNDEFVGTALNDSFRGNGGRDTFTGNAGADYFIFDRTSDASPFISSSPFVPPPTDELDYIVDFEAGVDKFVIEAQGALAGVADPALQIYLNQIPVTGGPTIVILNPTPRDTGGYYAGYVIYQEDGFSPGETWYAKGNFISSFNGTMQAADILIV